MQFEVSFLQFGYFTIVISLVQSCLQYYLDYKLYNCFGTRDFAAKE